MNINNQDQNDDSVDKLLKIFAQKPDETETTHSKNYQYHYQLP